MLSPYKVLGRLLSILNLKLISLSSNNSLFLLITSLSNNLKQESIEILMQDNLYLRTYDKDSIGYQELDIDNIRIEYKIDKACKIENKVRSNGNLYLKPFCEDKHMIIKELIDSLNNKEIYNFGDNMHVIKDITVYGKKENLDIIRKNMEE